MKRSQEARGTKTEKIVEEDNAEEISSISELTCSDENMRVQPKKKKLKKIEKNEITNEFTIHLNEPDTLRTNLYNKFVTYHAKIFNIGDVVKLKESILLPHAVPDLVTVQRHWSRPSKNGPAPANPMGQFNYAQFIGIEDSLLYCTSFFALVPDFLLKVSSPQIVVKEEVTKVICTYTFTGTLITTASLPPPVVEDPNNHIDEAREAVIKADPWAPPPGKTFQSEKTIRKKNADDVTTVSAETTVASSSGWYNTKGNKRLNNIFRVFY